VCLGIPGEVIELPAAGDLAVVDVEGVRRGVNIGLLEGQPLAVGEWVLIHVGFALAKVDEQEAADALQFLRGIGAAYDEELRAMQESAVLP
jgi:hydrogenase expression/formation protein HypC